MAAPNTSLQIYNAARARIASKFSDPRQQQLALQRFDSDPRVQQVRKLAGLAPVSTVQNDVKAVAKKALSAPVQALDDVARLVANGATFHFADKFARAMGEQDTAQKTQAASQRAGIVAPVADILGSLLTFGGIGKGIGLAAKSAVPAVSRVGNILQELGTFNKGQKLVNAGKIAAIGGATGGAQAAGTDQDILSGIAEGAVAAPLIAGAAKAVIPGLARAGQVLAAPFSDFLKLPNASRVLSKITSATTDQIEREWQNLKAVNPNAKPTLFELLPLADRNKIMSAVASKNDNVAEQAGQAITNRAKHLAPEMQARVDQILQPNRAAIHNGLVNDLTMARGGELKPGDAEIAKKAMNSTTDMDAFRKTEADAYMEPHNNKIVGSLNDILPSAPAPDGTRLELDPELSNAIRSVAGTARGVPDKPLQVSRVLGMIHSLKKPSATLDPNVAADAEEHLQNVLRNVDPEVAQSAQQMNDAYAGRSRMLEGMSAGSSTQLRDTIDTGTRAKSSRLVRNAYDTPEGTTGREIGQGNLILSDLGGGPGPALRLANDITGTNRDIGRELDQNLGPAASRITAVAQDTANSGQALGSALNKISGGAENSTSPLQALIQTAAALHPTSFASTKAKGVAKLTSWLGIPENRARTIVDMVFSSDPAMQQKAINALGNESNGSQFIKYLSGLTGKGVVDATTPPPQTPAAVDDSAAASEPADPYASIATPADANDPSTWEKRPDGSTKGMGFLGVMQRPDGSVSSEISVGLPINGKEMDIPTMVPGLTSSELHWLLTTPVERIAKELPDSIRQKAIAHAQQRITAGKSPFLEPNEAAPAATGTDPYADIAAPADPNAKISPYAAKLTETYANENPDLVALVQRQKQQESSGNQAAVSKKGAVGVMQVLGTTGPEAARFAGVPWDPNAWKNDSTYNELLGHAYTASLLRKYGGDVPKALAAYNDGQGKVDKAITTHGDQFLTALPPETQDYVARVGGQ